VKLKLIQSGGIAGKTMVAEATSKLKEKDFEELLKTVKTQRTRGGGRMKDAQTYVLQKGDDDTTAVSIDISAIPASHNELFKKLFENLRPKE
jgi:hypothetical protein